MRAQASVFDSGGEDLWAWVCSSSGVLVALSLKNGDSMLAIQLPGKSFSAPVFVPDELCPATCSAAAHPGTWALGLATCPAAGASHDTHLAQGPAALETVCAASRRLGWVLVGCRDEHVYCFEIRA